MNMYGFFRLATAVPVIKTADVKHNLQEMCKLYRQAAEKKAALVLFPELVLTGYSCGDLFFQELLLDSAFDAMKEFAEQTTECIAVFGLPIACGGKIYRAAVVARNGEICGISVPDNADKRYFSDLPEKTTELYGIPAGKNLLFTGDISFTVGENLHCCSKDADIVLLPETLQALPGNGRKNRTLLSLTSGELDITIISASTGCGESTTDILCSGQGLIVSGGSTAAELPVINHSSAIAFADVDISAARTRRRMKQTSCSGAEKIAVGKISGSPDFEFARINPHPFLPEEPSEMYDFCRETLEIQAAGLAHRMKICRAAKAVIGISGGLDSTLALIVTKRSCDMLGLPPSTILAVTMPGFGTTARTKNNALLLAEKLGADIREIPIADACMQHFSDLGHDGKTPDSVYENAQARERTQILMDLANKENGIVIGTGDLSELALGWCTYNGDQMSMYGVNCSIAKSVIPELLEYEAREELSEKSEILFDVIATPISPELLPAAPDGTPGQKTENILGAYELHDFFIWHTLVNGASPEKISAMAEKVFADKYPPEEIARCMQIFLRRFFTQQFKRSAAPDGIQASFLSLSPRGKLMMPSDAAASLWNF